MLGEENELKNRYLIINGPDSCNEFHSITQEQTDAETEKLGKDFDVILEKLGKKAMVLGKKLGKNRIEILHLVHQNPTATTVDMAKFIGISPTAIDNNIKQMRDIFIRRIGPKKGGHWEIITE